MVESKIFEKEKRFILSSVTEWENFRSKLQSKAYTARYSWNLFSNTGSYWSIWGINIEHLKFFSVLLARKLFLYFCLCARHSILTGTPGLLQKTVLLLKLWLKLFSELGLSSCRSESTPSRSLFALKISRFLSCNIFDNGNKTAEMCSMICTETKNDVLQMELMNCDALAASSNCTVRLA